MYQSTNENEGQVLHCASLAILTPMHNARLDPITAITDNHDNRAELPASSPSKKAQGRQCGEKQG
jgi:hypothetical protein